MSTEIETTDQDASETDQAELATLQEADATMDLGNGVEIVADDSDTDDNLVGGAGGIDLGDEGDQDEGDQDEGDEDEGGEDEGDTSMGEWSLCASMIFLAGYLVVAMFGVLGHPVWDTLVSFDMDTFKTKFPIGVATIILLISVLSAFCSLMSLVADKNNRQTLLIRLVTLGPLLPTLTAGFMIYIIINSSAGISILENFLG